jgi:hypothetical protein
LSSEHCGIEQPSTSEPGATVPQLPEPDPTNTALLVGNSYFINDQDEAILVSFESESMLSVTSSQYLDSGEQTEHQQGKWAMMLIISFEHDWLEFTITGGLGTSEITATEFHEGQLHNLTFNLITPVTPQDITAPLTLYRDDLCSMAIKFLATDAINGSAVIDATNCADINQEMMTDIFEQSSTDSTDSTSLPMDDFELWQPSLLQ